VLTLYCRVLGFYCGRNAPNMAGWGKCDLSVAEWGEKVTCLSLNGNLLPSQRLRVLSAACHLSFTRVHMCIGQHSVCTMQRRICSHSRLVSTITSCAVKPRVMVTFQGSDDKHPTAASIVRKHYLHIRHEGVSRGVSCSRLVD